MTDARRVALVTGSSSGIGAAVARRLAGVGMRVVVNSSRSVDAGTALAASLPDGVYVRADVGDEAQARGLVDAVVEQCGRLDVLVNNAATTRVIAHADLAAATPRVWRDIFDVNVFGTWQMCVAAMEHLRAGTDGCVVNVSSLASVHASGSSIPYAVSKAAINHMTRLLAAAVGPEVRVNAVAPGLIDTPWTADFADLRERIPALAPLRRIGTADDVAHAVLALVEAAYVTGEVVLVDGGMHLR
jgi:ketoreductase RED2